MTAAEPVHPSVHVTLDRAPPEKRRLFERLQGCYDELDRLQASHNRTPFGCKRSGQCCNVGLTLHEMECEWIALNLEREFQEGTKDREVVVRALMKAFDDPSWTNAQIIGDNWCSLFDGGCSVYLYRPAICRMFGVVIAADDWCPRERLSNGHDFVHVDPMTDDLVREYYSVLDSYGRRWKEKDRSVFYARGILSYLLPDDELAALRRRTAPRFWKTEVGYRAQYKTSKQVSRDWKKIDAALLKTVRAK